MTGIVICSRINSKRIPYKPLQKIYGVPIIRILISFLLPLNIPISLAIPESSEDMKIYNAIKDMNVILYQGSKDNVLDRFYRASIKNNFDTIIRITHDDIFQSPELIQKMLSQYVEKHADYMYCSNVIRGCDCEIVSIKVVEKAINHYEKLEHLSYAFRKYAMNSIDYSFWFYDSHKDYSYIDFSIDYPEDLKIVQCLFDYIESWIDFEDRYYPMLCLNDFFKCSKGFGAIKSTEFFPLLSTMYLKINEIEHLASLHSRPVVSVYTSCLNSESTIQRTVKSVLKQEDVNYEYLICDDGSSDHTKEVLFEYGKYDNVKLYQNENNKGVAYTSNKLISEAKGKYVMRLDADDEFYTSDCVARAVEWMEEHKNIAIGYMSYYDDDGNIHLNTDHHIGGAIVRKWMFEEVKFNEKLKHYDGYDLYQRVKKYFDIDYIDEPLWIYHYRKDSLSHNKEYRQQRERIYNALTQ